MGTGKVDSVNPDRFIDPSRSGLPKVRHVKHSQIHASGVGGGKALLADAQSPATCCRCGEDLLGERLHPG